MPGQNNVLNSAPADQSTISDNLFEVSNVPGGVVPAAGEDIMLNRVMEMHPTWIFFFLFALYGYFAWIRLYYGNIIIQTLQASTNFQVAARMFKDNSVLQKQLDNILYSFYFFSVSFLLFLLEEKFSLHPFGIKGFMLYLFNLLLLSGILFIRIVLINLVGFLFNRLELFREYLYHIFVFNKLLGVVILPLLLFMVYTTGWIREIFFWMALLTTALNITMRVIRGFVYSLKKDVLIFYMFLYLCALEIVPLALLWRWLEGVL